ncbi:MAG: hypothetical protein AAF368_05225 [Planctomycetota bacterium]
MSSFEEKPIAHECREFRSVLERTLREGSAGLAPLQWHEHLLGCGVCSELLRSEEALEMLLSSLPDPHLPPHLAQRVLMRLDASRLDLKKEQRGLDELLDLDRALIQPEGLSARVLHGVRGAAEADEKRLEALLDLDRDLLAPEGLSDRVLSGVRSAARAEERQLEALLEQAGDVEVPVGLSGRILSALEAERGLGSAPGATSPATIHSFFDARRALFAAAAAGVALWVGSTLLFPGAPELSPNEQLAGLDNPDPALLEDFDVLQSFDLLMDPDPDLVVASELDASTEVMLDLTEEL